MQQHLYNKRQNVTTSSPERFLQIPPSVAKGLEPKPSRSDFIEEAFLGKGSYGRVTLSRHKKTQAQYAIKAIDKRTKINKDSKQYFKREVEIMYKIRHPNVVRLFGHFEDETYCYFIMEYINKGSLYNLLLNKKKQPLEEKQVVSYIRDVISAVYYLHNMDPPIIHRDIKPENALLTETGAVKITDFGWSNYIVSDDDNQRFTFCGTPIYLAPEMMMKKGHDEHIDIWCIGCLMFELLTGRPPFEGPDKAQMSQNILNININWPHDMDRTAKDLITKILTKDPLKRLSLKEILEHRFFKQYFQDTSSVLIKPTSINEEPFVISKDIPTTASTTTSSSGKPIRKLGGHKVIKQINLIGKRDHSPLPTTSRLHLEQIQQNKVKIVNIANTKLNKYTESNNSNTSSNTNNNTKYNNEHPLLHIPSSATNLLSKGILFTQGINKNESNNNLKSMYKKLEKTYIENKTKLNDIYCQIKQLQVTEDTLRKELEDKCKKSAEYQKEIEQLEKNINEKRLSPLISRSKSFKKIESNVSDKFNRKDSADTIELNNSELLTTVGTDRSSNEKEKMKKEMRNEEMRYQSKINEIKNDNAKLIERIQMLKEKEMKNMKVIENNEAKMKQQENELAKYKKKVKDLETKLTKLKIMND